MHLAPILYEIDPCSLMNASLMHEIHTWISSQCIEFVSALQTHLLCRSPLINVSVDEYIHSSSFNLSTLLFKLSSNRFVVSTHQHSRPPAPGIDHTIRPQSLILSIDRLDLPLNMRFFPCPINMVFVKDIRSLAYNSFGHSNHPSNSPYGPVPIPKTFNPAFANGHDCASGGARISSVLPHDARGTRLGAARLKTGFVCCCCSC